MKGKSSLIKGGGRSIVMGDAISLSDPTIPVLATPEQRAAEEQMLALLADPDVIAMQQKMGAELSHVPVAQLRDGASRLTHVLASWTASLILRHISGDPERPAILWSTDNTPHSWFGQTIPATAGAGDNPDHIYRNAFIDGAGYYEILGQVDVRHRPAQYSIESTRGTPGAITISAAASKTKVKNQLGLLSDKNIQLNENGSFRLTVGPEDGGPNHLRSEAGSTTLIVRDVLSDWAQVPNHLVLRRLDRPMGNVADLEVLKQKVLADLPDYLRFWTAFPTGWMGGIPVNSYLGPVMRDGGWGYMVGIRYDLKPDQLILITIAEGRASYIGLQVTDPWLIGVDGKKHMTSLNKAQLRSNPDQTYSYVIASHDPGVANWIETGGLDQGFGILRWQGLEPGSNVDGLLRDFRIINQVELENDFPDIPRVTGTERRAQQKQHASDYELRVQVR